MKHWRVTFKLNRPYRGAVVSYLVDGDTKAEATEQARRIASVENYGALMTVISTVAITPVGTLGGAA